MVKSKNIIKIGIGIVLIILLFLLFNDVSQTAFLQDVTTAASGGGGGGSG